MKAEQGVTPPGHRLGKVAGDPRRASFLPEDQVPPHSTEGAEARDPRYINREISWLDFNSRVLAIAADRRLPALERAKFLAIVSRNLDDFFQVRVAGLRERIRAGIGPPAPDGSTPVELLSAIRTRVQETVRWQSRIFCDDVAPDLEEAGIRFSGWETLDADELAYLDDVFEQRIFPVLTPLAVDPAHPFPYISNLSMNLAVVVRDPQRGSRRIARVKVPPLLPRFVMMPDGERFVRLEEVIARNLSALFPGMEIVDQHPFRVTRNADFDTDEDDADDLLLAVENVLQRRRRSEEVVRLEVDSGMSQEVLGLLMRELDLQLSDVYTLDGPLDLRALWELYGLDRPELKDEPWIPTTEPRLVQAKAQAASGFAAILQAGDILVHHPYDSFATSVEAFVQQAADDPDVLAIKHTLYRTSGAESPIVRSLIRAAATGKQVVALVELKARFDEEANIGWARILEEAGVHVVYGVVDLKTHAKISLVVRDEGWGIRRYGHIGTGNYNPDTAHLYEDVGVLTADPELGADLSELFNFLTGYSQQRHYRKLLVAPVGLRSRLLDLIARESHDGGRIVIKINNLVDPEVIEALYGASEAGARIDLIVRSICCLSAGAPGFSENIRVRSIVGRYLEHSRIFRFGADEGTADYYIGSADLMPRNLDRRVEALVPVTDPALRGRLSEILQVNLEDDELAWELGCDGIWEKVQTRVGVNAHRIFKELAMERAHGTAAPARL
jgi:polyphosphate kinase